MTKTLISSFIFLFTLFIVSCAPSINSQKKSFPEFDNKVSQSLPEFEINDNPLDSSGFPIFNPNALIYSAINPPNFRPFIRVLIGENQRKWIHPKGQNIEIFEGSPLSNQSIKHIQSDEEISFEVCGSALCLNSNQGQKKLSPPIWYKSREPFLTSNQGNYRGVFVLEIENNKLQIINIVGLEHYIQGILPYEIGTLPDWGFEALKAQALAARTYTLKRLKPLNEKSFDLYSDTRDQVYKGLKQEYDLSNQAVLETRGQVLSYNSELAETFYHSTSAGYTANIAKVWDTRSIEYLRGQKDLDQNGESWSKESSWSNWSYTFSLSEISKTANSRLKTLKAQPELSFNSIDEIKILNRHPSGRVNELLIKSDKGNFIVKGDKTRWLFEPPRLSILPSSWFWIENQGNQVKISGKGFGHGIGLCQMGARARSKAGQSYQVILESYYPGTQINQVPF